MWVFTKYGFYSIACADQAGRGRKIDPDTVMVRARTKQHLQNLKERFAFMLVGGNFAIEDRKETDYRFRILMPKATWVKMLTVLAEEQEWSNFKNEASKMEKLKGWNHKYVGWAEKRGELKAGIHKSKEEVARLDKLLAELEHRSENRSGCGGTHEEGAISAPPLMVFGIHGHLASFSILIRRTSRESLCNRVQFLAARGCVPNMPR
jgi:hypothetical protein